MLSRKLKALGVTTVELGTGNYPGDPHCKLAMLEDTAALSRNSRNKLDDNGFTISALSCHGNALHPDPEIGESPSRSQPQDGPAGANARAYLW